MRNWPWSKKAHLAPVERLSTGTLEHARAAALQSKAEAGASLQRASRNLVDEAQVSMKARELNRLRRAGGSEERQFWLSFGQDRARKRVN
jgi:hypothetical protein